MREDIKSLLDADKDLSIETVDELDNKILATNFFENMANDIDEFDKVAWENKAGFDTPSFPSFTEGLEGWSPGFYCFAGAANMGLQQNGFRNRASGAFVKIFRSN